MIASRLHDTCDDDNYYVSRMQDKVINIYNQHFALDILDFDTALYGGPI